MRKLSDYGVHLSKNSDAEELFKIVKEKFNSGAKIFSRKFHIYSSIVAPNDYYDAARCHNFLNTNNGLVLIEFEYVNSCGLGIFNAYFPNGQRFEIKWFHMLEKLNGHTLAIGVYNQSNDCTMTYSFRYSEPTICYVEDKKRKENVRISSQDFYYALRENDFATILNCRFKTVNPSRNL